MVPISILAAVVASYFAATSTAQFSNQTTLQCLAAGYSATQCSLCPLDINPFNTIGCASYTASFDNAALTPGLPVPTYKNANWPGWYTLPQSQPYTATTLGPRSGSNYGSIAPGTEGTIDFGIEGGVSGLGTKGSKYPVGQLRYFNFACALSGVNDPPKPARCNIRISAFCLPNPLTNLVTGLTGIPFQKLDVTIPYDPSLVIRDPVFQKTGMAYQAIDFAATFGIGQVAIPQYCMNYTFSAEAVDPNGPFGTIIVPGFAPGPVLLMDDIYFNSFYKK